MDSGIGLVIQQRILLVESKLKSLRLIISTPIGSLQIISYDATVMEIEILSRRAKDTKLTVSFERAIHKQLTAYFKDPKYKFSLPILLTGTEFQRRVWRALQKIPVGQTLTYGELANKIHSGARAVGNACRANPVPVIVPCHRVVASQGLGGYGGTTVGKRLAIKRWLLNHESANIVRLGKVSQ